MNEKIASLHVYAELDTKISVDRTGYAYAIELGKWHHQFFFVNCQACRCLILPWSIELNVSRTRA